uniref:C3H1-type domain-containing protein n=1 Tax=Alexandrium monilatum TaxID=311494 RepID=A0A7S4RCH7_9DINO
MHPVLGAYMSRRSIKARKENTESRVVFRQQFFKTELCRFYSSGCAKGDDCCFAHGEGDLRTAPDLNKTSLCEAWVNRRCPLKADACPFAHGWGDMRTTPAFVEYGARQSKKGPASGALQGKAVAACGKAAGARGKAGAPLRPAAAARAPRRSSCRSDDSARSGPEAGARADSPASSTASSQPAEKPSPEVAGAPQDGSPVGQAGQAGREPLPVAIVLQPWWGPGEVPLLPLQMAPAGVLPPRFPQELPDNRVLEALLKQAMPDHYDD